MINHETIKMSKKKLKRKINKITPKTNKQTNRTLQGHLNTRVHLSTLKRNLITFLNYISISVI